MKSIYLEGDSDTPIFFRGDSESSRGDLYCFTIYLKMKLRDGLESTRDDFDKPIYLRGDNRRLFQNAFKKRLLIQIDSSFSNRLLF